MREQENVEALRALYEKWADTTLDPGDWIDALADDVRWRSIGEGAPGLEFSNQGLSKDGVARYFEELRTEWEMLHYSTDEFVADGDRVVVIGRCGWRHRRTGKAVETPKVDIFRMRDGKITDFYELFDTAKAFAAAQGDADDDA